MHADGWSLRAIARELGISHETARTDLRELTGAPAGAAITGRVVARQPTMTPSTAPATRASSPPATTGRGHQDHAPARPPRLPAVRVPGLLAQVFGRGAARRRDGAPPCDDCAAGRVREPSGQFPAAIARDRATGRAVCDYHARERNGGRLHSRDLARLPDQTQPTPGQWRVTITYPRPPAPGRAEPLPAWRNETVDVSGWYG